MRALLTSHLEVQIHALLYQQFHDSVLFVHCGNMEACQTWLKDFFGGKTKQNNK